MSEGHSQSHNAIAFSFQSPALGSLEMLLKHMCGCSCMLV